MKRLIAAASAALVLACAGSASAATVIETRNGVFSGTFATGRIGVGEPFTGQRFKVEFTTDALVDYAQISFFEQHHIREYTETGAAWMWDDYDVYSPIILEQFPATTAGNFTVYFTAGAEPPGDRVLENGHTYSHYYEGEFFFDFSKPDDAPGAAYTVVVSSIPEPASWGLMIVGFGATGMVLRGARPRRRSALSA